MCDTRPQGIFKIVLFDMFDFTVRSRSSRGPSNGCCKEYKITVQRKWFPLIGSLRISTENVKKVTHENSENFTYIPESLIQCFKGWLFFIVEYFSVPVNNGSTIGVRRLAMHSVHAMIGTGVPFTWIHEESLWKTAIVQVNFETLSTLAVRTVPRNLSCTAASQIELKGASKIELS